MRALLTPLGENDLSIRLLDGRVFADNFIVHGEEKEFLQEMT